MYAYLPHIIRDFGVELKWALPAFFEADLLDDGEVVGGERELATMVLVVGGAAAVGTEAVLEGLLNAFGHVAVKTGLHTKGHGDGLVVAVQVTGSIGGKLVTGAYTFDDTSGRVDILSRLPAETVVVLGARVVEATEIFLCLLTEQGFFIFLLN